MIRGRICLAHPGFALNAAFELPAHGVCALWGPSGCGKTSLLRCLAGLERAATGMLEVDGQLWLDSANGVFVPPHRRAAGYVVQEASLFPHLSVRENLEFGMQRTPAAERRIAWERALELLELGPLLARQPKGLSGGERQRITIARTLLAGPRWLLMDEPLAALDGARKRELLELLERLQRELAMPVLYVSHQMEEVVQLAEHIIVLDQGRVAASGPLAQTLARLDLPLAHDDDAGVLVQATVAAYDAHYHLTRLEFPGGAIQVARAAMTPGQSVRMRIRARDVSLALSEYTDSSILNRLAARVCAIGDTSNPANVLVQLDAGGTLLLARISRLSCDHLRLQTGSAVWAQVKAATLTE